MDFYFKVHEKWCTSISFSCPYKRPICVNSKAFGSYAEKRKENAGFSKGAKPMLTLII